MLRLTEIKLPLDHPKDDLKAAILARLGIAADELIGIPFSVAALMRANCPRSSLFIR